MKLKLAGIDIVGPGPGYLHVFIDKSAFTIPRVHLVVGGTVYVADIPLEGEIHAVVEGPKSKDGIFMEAKTLTAEQIAFLEEVRPILRDISEEKCEVNTITASQD